MIYRVPNCAVAIAAALSGTGQQPYDIFIKNSIKRVEQKCNIELFSRATVDAFNARLLTIVIIYYYFSIFYNRRRLKSYNIIDYYLNIKYRTQEGLKSQK